MSQPAKFGTVAFVLCVASATGNCGGFAIADQSPSSAAHASVGVAAGLPDASAGFYNPASITALRRPEFEIGVGMGFPHFRYHDNGSEDAIGGPMRGSESTNMQTSYVPDVFAVLPVTNALSTGIAVTAPFGDATRYDPNWVGRYFVTSIKLDVIDVEPVVAWRIDDRWSAGVGIDWQRANLSQRSTIDFGSICLGTLQPESCQALGLEPQAADGQLDLSGTSEAWGYDVGVLARASDKIRVGVNYRSKVKHDFRGSGNFDVPFAATPLQQSGAFRDTSVSTSLTFPESVDLGAAIDVSDAITLYASAKWTRWSRINQYVIAFDNPAQPPIVENPQWRDTIRSGAAVDYRVNDKVTLSAGLAYEPSPVPGDRRQPTLPDSDSVILGGGAVWNVSRDGYLAASINYYHMANAGVEVMAPASGTLRGSYASRLIGVGVGAGLRF